MSQIINKVRDVDPNNSDAVKDVLTAFFQNLSNYTEVDCNKWLRVLEDILIRFPKYCSSHRNTIEHYLVHFLSSNNYYNVIEAAKCAHALQQIKPSQDKAATAKNCWREQMSILCEAAHKLTEAVFTKTIKIYKISKKLQKYEAKLLANTPLTTALCDMLNITKDDSTKTMLCTRLRNVFVFIQAMLVEIYPVAKPIQPQLILEVILQALSMSNNISSISAITTIKIQALKTLDALVACLGPNLIPFSALVFRFVMQTLRWSLDNPSEESRKVRCAAYASLGKWLSALHTYRPTHGQAHSWEDQLTNHILEDITPPKRVVQLTMSSIPTKNLSKKAKRKLANSMLLQSNIASHMPGEKDKIPVSEEVSEEVANAALDCAETFLTVCGIFLKPATHKMFQERLVRECYNLESYTSERGVRLLQALDACRKNCPPSMPPPTQYCLHLYSTLLNARHDEIKRFCSRALLEIRLHLHCSPPSINFAIEPQLGKKNTDKRNKVSEKNRAALESLLGKERMPLQTQEEEVITILDEPQNKRPRLEEDIADKISVSSESVNSVEISDDSDVEESAIQEADGVMIQGNETIDDVSNMESEIVEEINIQINDSDDAITEQETMVQKRNDDITIPITQTNKNISENIETETTGDQTADTADRIISIYDAKTQVPLNISHDTEEGEKSPVSMEVGYDCPNVTNKVTELDKMDDENLPSTNDTDDVQIACGQHVKSSQELDLEKNKAEEVPTVNGIIMVNGESGEMVENGETHNGFETNEAKTLKEVTIEDMLADFVDEVNGGNIIEA